MKKFFWILSCSLSLCFWSCGDDSSDITGTYKIVSISSSQCEDPDLNFSYNFENNDCITELGVEVCLDGTFTLGENESFTGSFTISALGSNFTESFSGTYTIDGNDIIICENEGDCENGTISNNGNEISLRFPEDDDNCILVMKGKK